MQMVHIIKYIEGDEPDLEAVVPASSLPHHVRAGWRVLDESPEPAAEEPPKPARRRNKTAVQEGQGEPDTGGQDTDKQESE